jgi:hypothetical protein
MATYTAFLDHRRLASGELADVLPPLKKHFDRNPGAALLVFEDESGGQIDFDLRGSLAEVVARAQPRPARPAPGRPRLGVVSREVSLLPRHWDWLEQQPNGISAALRRLVDEARKRHPEEARQKRARAAANRFMTAMAGDRPGFEEASRALFAGDQARLAELTAGWPEDIRKHVSFLLAGPAGAGSTGEREA